MKSPILKYHERNEFEVAKLRFKREFERSPMGLFLKDIVEWLNEKIK